MLISPSVASSDLLHLEEETTFAACHFGQIHIDIEDGTIVPNITMGMKVCQEICEKWKDAYRSIHLSVLEPLKYLERVKKCKADIVFLALNHLEHPWEVLEAYRAENIPTGISVSNLDLVKDKKILDELLRLSEQVVVVTNKVGDPERRFQYYMEKVAEDIADTYNLSVWLDGNVDYKIWKELESSKLYGAVMGGAIYRDKELALHQFCGIAPEQKKVRV